MTLQGAAARAAQAAARAGLHHVRAAGGAGRLAAARPQEPQHLPPEERQGARRAGRAQPRHRPGALLVRALRAQARARARARRAQGQPGPARAARPEAREDDSP